MFTGNNDAHTTIKNQNSTLREATLLEDKRRRGGKVGGAETMGERERQRREDEEGVRKEGTAHGWEWEYQ